MPFTLRPWTPDDLGSLVKYANNPKIANNLTDRFPYPYTAADGKAFIAFAGSNSPLHVFAIDVNGEAVGGIGIHPQSDIQRRNAELGYWLAEPFWGQGIMSEAVRQMIAYGFSTFDITRIFARPYAHNIASQKILEKNGFVLEARLSNTLYKNNEFRDELIYAIRSANPAGTGGLKRIHHVALICSDYERSKHFYTEVLGLAIGHETYREARRSWKLDLLLNGEYVLELFSFPDPPKRVTQPEAAGLRHLAFEVDSVEAMIAELKKSGITAEPVRTDEFSGKKFTFISDPDGLPVELYEK